ncbi:tRNA 2-selenouridine(34) synthase MnmH [Thermoflavifilum thermophilum]|uniref:tRNA 2-selenouridine synthase n=1 Tax=Thermoflavifilum thermophilum TaxID=1393122 RepID=A0A1I7NAE6_9BACT|nr:tRNA 2-selenouridine(34) synthase MnmH [Thermoflavifilum thermophilum]SFV31647.1 tRNA 2-selenouridine synthase [Thermoflavifilum thermophilum]
MPIHTISVEEFLQWVAAGHLPVIDVRSPAEFNHAHVPGAHHLPLFSDEQRAIVGTIYHREGKQAAIRAGLDFFGPKMRNITEQAESILKKYHPDQQSVCLYCWRGGMRSKAIAWLLDLMGYSVYLLQGGYKAFRNAVLQGFSRPLPIRLMGGYTGSGKTRMLHKLREQGIPVISLEDLAHHRGSAFGDLGMPLQPTQEMFENLLATEIFRLLQHPGIRETGIWMEDESQRIGDLVIPPALWQQMRKAPLYFLEVPFEQRLQQIVAEYGIYDRGLIEAAILRISKRLGGAATQQALDYLHARQIKACFEILLHYYDKLYLKSLHQRDPSVPVHPIPVENASEQHIIACLKQAGVSWFS